MIQGGKPGGPTRLGGSGSGGGAGSSSDLDVSAATSASMSMAGEGDASMIGEVLDGRYKIVKKLGEGGMGEVYAAEHVHIAKKVAIKLLRREVVSNEEAVSRFRQEARSASTIGHRNIIGIDDFGQLKDGRIYLCMEFLNGLPLNELILEQQPTERLLNILIQTGHGLAAAHAKGIIHRDMKPENIFVTFTPQGEDIPKLLDFGIAKVGGQDGSNNLTKTGTIFGTPYYMAPEQALGQAIDGRVDVYALGIIAYEVFSGSLPFQGESFMGILTQHITTEPEPVAQRAAKAGKTLPLGLAEAITRALAKDPDRRYRSMDEFVNALVGVYRNLVGPGMSAYLEAQGGRSSSSQPNVGGSAVMPVRPSASGPSAPGSPSAMLSTLAAPGSSAMPATLIATGGALPSASNPGPSPPGHGQGQGPGMPPMGGPGPGMPMGPPPMGGPGMQPYPGGQGGPYPPAPYQGPPHHPMGAHPGASGMYSGDSQLMPPRRGKAGLYAVIIAAVVVIGGVIAVVAMQHKKDDGKTPPIAGATIDAAVGELPATIDAGVGGPVADVVDAAVAHPAIDAAIGPAPTVDARPAPAIDAGTVTPPTNSVDVAIRSTTAGAEVYVDGMRRGRAPQTVEVAAGETHDIVVKASGFKDQAFTIDGLEPKVDVKLRRLGGGPGTGGGSGSGSSHPPPPPDCDANPTDVRCGL